MGKCEMGKLDRYRSVKGEIRNEGLLAMFLASIPKWGPIYLEEGQHGMGCRREGTEGLLLDTLSLKCP